jgi:hypothetical protein
MTRKDCEQHGLQYYDIWPKKGGTEEVARTMTGQPLLENLNSEPESAMRACDSSVDVETPFSPSTVDSDLTSSFTRLTT